MQSVKDINFKIYGFQNITLRNEIKRSKIFQKFESKSFGLYRVS